ncbi:MAG: hypothetical protein OEN21_15395 [Myxococcales bacterium]|nr:hypothetical protein [Myxococcales bacterium]
MATSKRFLSEFRMIRGACALTTLLALLLQGSSGGHMLLVEHGRCAAHGELVHGGAHQHEAGQDRHAESAVLHGVPDADSNEAHDHCLVLTDRRDALVSIADAGTDIRVLEMLGELSRLGAEITSSTCQLQLAPKTSPPA